MGKHLRQSIKLASDYKFIKNETLARVFSCELPEISKNNFCIEDLSVTASVVSKEFYKIFRIFFSRKNIKDNVFRSDNLVKRVVFCYPREIFGEFS